mmetsp:Transcript_40756/g.85367  ORF Transcript_40756/g.85367 Transcript_40756/m.85367 type:complete len:378 (-) Transcript_40756:1270-2403(-)
MPAPLQHAQIVPAILLRRIQIAGGKPTHRLLPSLGSQHPRVPPRRRRNRPPIAPRPPPPVQAIDAAPRGIGGGGALPPLRPGRGNGGIAHPAPSHARGTDRLDRVHAPVQTTQAGVDAAEGSGAEELHLLEVGEVPSPFRKSHSFVAVVRFVVVAVVVVIVAAVVVPPVVRIRRSGGRLALAPARRRLVVERILPGDVRRTDPILEIVQPRYRRPRPRGPRPRRSNGIQPRPRPLLRGDGERFPDLPSGQRRRSFQGVPVVEAGVPSRVMPLSTGGMVVRTSRGGFGGGGRRMMEELFRHGREGIDAHLSRPVGGLVVILRGGRRGAHWGLAAVVIMRLWSPLPIVVGVVLVVVVVAVEDGGSQREIAKVIIAIVRT